MPARPRSRRGWRGSCSRLRPPDEPVPEGDAPLSLNDLLVVLFKQGVEVRERLCVGLLPHLLSVLLLGPRDQGVREYGEEVVNREREPLPGGVGELDGAATLAPLLQAVVVEQRPVVVLPLAAVGAVIDVAIV